VLSAKEDNGGTKIVCLFGIVYVKFDRFAKGAFSVRVEISSDYDRLPCSVGWRLKFRIWFATSMYLFAEIKNPPAQVRLRRLSTVDSIIYDVLRSYRADITSCVLVILSSPCTYAVSLTVKNLTSIFAISPTTRLAVV
jgi:hypothetical protein